MVTNQVYDWDLIGEIDGLGDLLERLNARKAFGLVNAERDAGMAAFISARQQANT